jgi:hypothetical protein
VSDRTAPAHGAELMLASALVAALCGGGCGGSAETLSSHRQALTSSTATAAMIADAWLSGAVSATYARTGFEATARLLAERQSELSDDLPLLATPPGAAMSDAEEHVSRIVASMADAIGRADSAAVRRDLQALHGQPTPP